MTRHTSMDEAPWPLAWFAGAAAFWTACGVLGFAWAMFIAAGLAVLFKAVRDGERAIQSLKLRGWHKGNL